MKTRRAGAGDENGSPPRAQPLDVGRIESANTISSPDAMTRLISNCLSDKGLEIIEAGVRGRPVLLRHDLFAYDLCHYVMLS